MESNQGLLTYVKRVIRSLVISTPIQITVDKLSRDYVSEEGCSVPYGRLGYGNFESFLRSISDTVNVYGHGPNAVVKPVTSSKSAHIQNLVQCQNKKKTKPSRKPNYFYSQNSGAVFINARSQMENRRNNFQNNRQQRFNQSLSSYSKGQELQNKANTFKQKSTKTSNVTKSFSEVSIASENDAPAPAPVIIDLESLSLSDKSSKLTTVVPLNDVTAEEPKFVYESEDNSEEIVASVIDYLSSDNCNACDEDAIPAYAVDDRIIHSDYPQEAVRVDYKLPEHELPKYINVGDRIRVQLVKVNTPHDFYYWILDEQHEDYMVMSQTMQHLYNGFQTNNFNLPTFLMTVGHLCAVRSKLAVWERAKIHSFNVLDTRNQVEVLLIDTGETMCTSSNDVKYLHRDFATLPAQYLQGRMACCTPWRGSYWPLSAINFFSKLVHHRELYAKIELINQEEKSVYMILVDPDAESFSKNVNATFIESGWARRCMTP